MQTEATSGSAGGCGTGVIPSRVWFGAPPAGGEFGALECVVAKLVTVEALGRRVETEASLKSVVGGEGREAWLLSKLLCLGASNGEDNSGGKFPPSHFLSSEPPWLLGKNKAGVVGGEFFADVGKGVGSRDVVHKDLCSRRVQMDTGSARDEVEELGDLAVKRGGPNRIHGGK